MSLSVNGWNNNPFAYLQSLWQQGLSASGTQAQSDPLSALLAELGQQGTAGTPASATTSSASGATTVPGGTATQFGPQTLQALLALQSGGSDPQSLLSQFANAATGADPAAAAQTPQSPGQHGHHHRMGTGGSSSGTVGQNPLAMLTAAGSGATSQTTTGADGATTTSITYADGSTVTLTSPAAGSSTTSAGAGSVAGNNLIEQLIQMQAQLLNPANTQSIATV
jgi:hypothetical protein